MACSFLAVQVLKVNYFRHQMAINLTEKNVLAKDQKS